MKKKKCEKCNGSKCIICPICEGEGSNDYKKCKCTPTPYNINPCGDGNIKCTNCNGTGEIND